MASVASPFAPRRSWFAYLSAGLGLLALLGVLVGLQAVLAHANLGLNFGWLVAAGGHADGHLQASATEDLAGRIRRDETGVGAAWHPRADGDAGAREKSFGDYVGRGA